MMSSIISFSKTMFSSSVNPPYHLPLPKQFCDLHLPHKNTRIILVGETEQEYGMMYLVNRNRVVGADGWGSFVVAHGLIEGDNLLFHLIDQCKFKVHITRASRSTEHELQKDKLVDLVKLDDLIEENASIDNTATQKNYPTSAAENSPQMQGRVLRGNRKRVDEKVVPKEMMNHVKLDLSQQYFSCRKELQVSHLYHKFNMTLPKEFCDEHLPRHDVNIILVDESEREYNVRYGVNRCRLAYGWRDFAIAHGLLEGDFVIFHLVDRRKLKFKVHIVRGSRSIEGGEGVNLLTSYLKREDVSEENACYGNTVAHKNSSLSAVDIHQIDRMPRVKKRRNVDMVLIEKVYVRRKYRSTETIGACDTDSAALSENENTESAFNLKCFEDLKICVNGKMLDSEIPADIRMKYYELCCVEKRSLHDHVKKDLNSKLVVSMIQNIVRISESIKATSILTSLHHLVSMDKTLKSFEDLGMTVGSLRAKIGKLIKVLNEHHSVVESTIVRLEALECERKGFLEKKTEIDELMESAMAHGRMIGRLEESVDGAKQKMDKLSMMLKETAGLTQ